VFRKDATEDGGQAANQPHLIKINTMSGPWLVHFDPAMRGPEQPITFDSLSDWSKSNNPEIKYYAGKAVYQHTFNQRVPAEGERIVLDLGKLVAIAKVKVNGRLMGGVWTAPYCVDITEAVRQGRNELEIEVVNTWVNRLIGDSALPEKDRKTWVSTSRYNSSSPLVPAGLLGPVSIRTEINTNKKQNNH